MAQDVTTGSSDLLDEVQRLAGMGFWEYDVVNDVVTWSDELFRIYGLEPQSFEATYEAFLERIHPDDRKMVDATVQQAFGTREAWSFDHRLVRPDGQVRWLHGRGHVQVVDDQITRLVGTAMDVTDRKRTEERLRTFIANASHELRTPTAAIIHAVEALERLGTDATERRSQVMAVLQRQAESLRHLTRNLLDLATVDSGTTAMLLGAVPVAEVARGVVQTLGATDVHVQIGDDLLAHADREALGQVLTNLITNAQKHGEPPVQVLAQVDGGEVVLVVQDAGAGPDELSSEDLFTPFIAGGSGRGIGLGLPIVQGLVRAMGGSVDHAPLDGQPGRFVVRLGVAP